MFSFGRRKKYNGQVDAKLNNEYQISTKDNPNFPEVLAYLKFIDNAWGAKMTEDEGALYIATLYYCGLRKQGLHSEADTLCSRVDAIVCYGLPRGMISEHHWRELSDLIRRANLDAANELLTQRVSYQKSEARDASEHKFGFEFKGGMPYFLKHQPRFKYDANGYEIYLFESLVSVAEALTGQVMPIRFKYSMVLMHSLSGDLYMIVTLEQSLFNSNQYFLCAFEGNGDHLNLGSGEPFVEIDSFEAAALKFLCDVYSIDNAAIKKYIN